MEVSLWGFDAHPPGSELPLAYRWNQGMAQAARDARVYLIWPAHESRTPAIQRKLPRFRSSSNITRVWNSSRADEGKKLVYFNSIPKSYYQPGLPGYFHLRVVATHDMMLRFLRFYGFATTEYQARHLIRHYGYNYFSVLLNINHLREALQAEILDNHSYPHITPY